MSVGSPTTRFMLEPLAIRLLPGAGTYWAVMSLWAPGASVLRVMLAVPTLDEPTCATLCEPISLAPS